jgi:hypothetical protein
MSVDLVRRTMLEAFKERHVPTGFFSNMFKTQESYITSTLKVDIDIKRSGNPYAVDVHRNSGGNFNKSSKFNSKEFEPPYFDEYESLNAYEIFNRQVGVQPYSDSDIADIVSSVREKEQNLIDKIERAKEKMCSDILFSGAATFVNNTSVDYVMKATHQISVTAWSGSTAKQAVLDLIGAANVIRKDSGAVKTNTFNVILGETSRSELMALLAATTSEYKMDVLGLADFQKTLQMGIDGATFLGKIAGGAFNFLFWSYPQFYTIPTGFGLGSEGTQAAYVPAEQVLGKYLTYFREDVQAQCIIVGVRSAPLPIPVQIDGYAYLNT